MNAKMFRTWSRALQRPEVRGLLVATGVLVTIIFAPLLVFGTYVLMVSLFSDAPDRWHFIGWSVVGTAGLLGMAGAWTRILVSGARLQTKQWLRWGTVICLAAGVVVAGLTFLGIFRDPANIVSWMMLPILVIGLFLLGATLGEVPANNTFETVE